MKRILIIEDDENLSRGIAFAFEATVHGGTEHSQHSHSPLAIVTPTML